MSTETLLYIVLSGIVALLLALFQYWYKTRNNKSNRVFAFLRFLTIYSILLLLVNPKLEQTSYFIEKPNLVVAVDNSESVKFLRQDSVVNKLVDEIEINNAINEKFNLQFYTFGSTIKNSDSITFSESDTNVDKVFQELDQIYRGSISPTIILTDGNQTYGNDYTYSTSKYNQSIYPIILGDTLTVSDIKIKQLNVNKYAYLKNKFPVEVIIVYNGNETINKRFSIISGNSAIYNETIRFSKEDNSKIINTTLPASSVGVQTFKARIEAIENEKNVLNNHKNFAVEVIDQKTNVAIVSDMLHPDLGTLKKSIESNEQRSVSFLNPREAIQSIDDYQLVILYQPNYSFKQLYKEIDLKGINKFVITGTKTSWSFINTLEGAYKKDTAVQTEDYQAVLNTHYNTFIIDDLGFESFPPLKTRFGNIVFSVPIETILNKKVNGVILNEPLLATIEINNRREAILFGENIWQWRAQSYLNNESFTAFDDFIGKLVQYLASNKKKDRLTLDYESFYNGTNRVNVQAQFFNKNYEFDSTESLTITTVNNETKDQKSFPFLLKNNNYQVNLSSLPAGSYSFTVKSSRENIARSGSFTILDFNIEQQFLNADVTKLQSIATNSDGKSYFATNTESLVEDLLNDERYKSIQKSTKNIVPLIDWKYLLGFILFCLATEWFLRKYKGLI